MTENVLTTHDVMTAVRNSKCKRATGRHRPRFRDGISANSLEDAVQVLAHKLNANIALVRPLVDKLIALGKLAFESNRLKATRRKNTYHAKQRATKNSKTAASLTPEQREARDRAMMQHPSWGVAAQLPKGWDHLSPEATPEEVLAANPQLARSYA